MSIREDLVMPLKDDAAALAKVSCCAMSPALLYVTARGQVPPASAAVRVRGQWSLLVHVRVLPLAGGCAADAVPNGPRHGVLSHR